MNNNANVGIDAELRLAIEEEAKAPPISVA